MESSSRRHSKGRLSVLAVCIFVIMIPLAHLAANYISIRYYAPIETAYTVHDVASGLPVPFDLYEVAVDGKTYYLIDAGFRSSLFLPSGPVIYLFDGNGVLVEWSEDAGECNSQVLALVLGDRAVRRSVTLEQITVRPHNGVRRGTP